MQYMSNTGKLVYPSAKKVETWRGRVFKSSSSVLKYNQQLPLLYIHSQTNDFFREKYEFPIVLAL